MRMRFSARTGPPLSDSEAAPSANVRPEGSGNGVPAQAHPPHCSPVDDHWRVNNTFAGSHAYRKLRTVTKASAAGRPTWEPRQMASARTASTERESGAGRIWLL